MLTMQELSNAAHLSGDQPSAVKLVDVLARGAATSAVQSSAFAEQ